MALLADIPEPSRSGGIGRIEVDLACRVDKHKVTVVEVRGCAIIRVAAAMSVMA